MAEPKVSDKMKKGIKLCEECLHIKYEGKTFDDAKKFLDINMPLIQDKDFREYKKPSQKMLDAIAIIEHKTGDLFTGESMLDASKFIEKHYKNVFGDVTKSSNKKRGRRR